MALRLSELIDIEDLLIIKCNITKTSLPTAEQLKSLNRLTFSECYGLQLQEIFPSQLDVNSISRLTMWRMQSQHVCPKLIQKFLRSNKLKEIRVSTSCLLEAVVIAAKSECKSAGYNEITFLYGSNRRTCHSIKWLIEEKQIIVKITDAISFNQKVLDHLEFDHIAVNLQASLVNSVAGWMRYFGTLGERSKTLILEGFVDMRCKPSMEDAATAMAQNSAILRKLTKLHTLELEINPTENVLSAGEIKKIQANMQKLIANAQKQIDRIIFVRKDQLTLQAEKGLKIDEVCGEWCPNIDQNRLTCINSKNKADI